MLRLFFLCFHVSVEGYDAIYRGLDRPARSLDIVAMA